MRILLVLLMVACGAAQRPRATDGSIAGLARDRASGEPVGMADVRVRSQAGREVKTLSAPDGLYAIDHLAPGTYTLLARFAGQPVTIKNIAVKAGDAIFVDVTFTLGNPEPILVDFGDPTQGMITRYSSARGPRIEGTVSEAGSRERISGAVITAERGSSDETLQTVSDDQGRYHFDSVPPGTYAVSAYYSISGRGQIEVRRGDIEVQPADGVIVPLWVELEKL